MDIYTKEKRKTTSVTLPSSLLEDAKAYNINLSRSLEASIAAQIKAKKEQEWREENREAIAATNREVEKRSLLLQAYWLRDYKSDAV